MLDPKNPSRWWDLISSDEQNIWYNLPPEISRMIYAMLLISPYFIYAKDAPLVVERPGEYVLMEDLQCENTAIYSNGCKDFTIYGNKKTIVADAAMKFENCKNVIIDGDDQTLVANFGVLVKNCKNLKIKNIVVSKCKIAGMEVVDVAGLDIIDVIH